MWLFTVAVNQDVNIIITVTLCLSSLPTRILHIPYTYIHMHVCIYMYTSYTMLSYTKVTTDVLHNATLSMQTYAYTSKFNTHAKTGATVRDGLKFSHVHVNEGYRYMFMNKISMSQT